jgi:hypothetical protein
MAGPATMPTVILSGGRSRRLLVRAVVVWRIVHRGVDNKIAYKTFGEADRLIMTWPVDLGQR